MFSTKTLQNQEQVILNNVYREWFLSFWWGSGGMAPNGVGNKSLTLTLYLYYIYTVLILTTVSKLTQDETGATN